MDWKALGKKLADIGLPMLGTALMGPAGGTVGAMIASAIPGKDDDVALDPANPASIARAIDKYGPEAVDVLKAKLEADVTIQRIAAETEVAKLREVNQTMREESKSEHWPQYSWRPFNGFCYPVAVITVYFVLPLLSKTVPTIPQAVWIGWLAILGVATWDRGKEKRIKAGEEARPGLIESAINAIKGSGQTAGG